MVGAAGISKCAGLDRAGAITTTAFVRHLAGTGRPRVESVALDRIDAATIDAIKGAALTDYKKK